MDLWLIVLLWVVGVPAYLAAGIAFVRYCVPPCPEQFLTGLLVLIWPPLAIGAVVGCFIALLGRMAGCKEYKEPPKTEWTEDHAGHPIPPRGGSGVVRPDARHVVKPRVIENDR